MENNCFNELTYNKFPAPSAGNYYNFGKNINFGLNSNNTKNYIVHLYLQNQILFWIHKKLVYIFFYILDFWKLLIFCDTICWSRFAVSKFFLFFVYKSVKSLSRAFENTKNYRNPFTEFGERTKLKNSVFFLTKKTFFWRIPRTPLRQRMNREKPAKNRDVYLILYLF